MTARVNGIGWETREPCGSCPYRKDAPLELWHRQEYESVYASEHAECIGGSVFGCHATLKKDPEVCAGWLLDQKRRGIPSIPLRLRLMRLPDARAALDEVTDGGHETYDSALEMCAANGVG